GLLRHRIRHLGMNSAQLAEEAILPEPLVTAWLDGAPVTPSQLLRCVPALQLSEDVLLEALEGKRDTAYWPLPVPPPDQQGHPGRLSEWRAPAPCPGEGNRSKPPTYDPCLWHTPSKNS
ncbi:hypothetical protein PV416_47140, partial [Streptomyces ipomoeae]